MTRGTEPRLLLTSPLTGAENMALDEALLQRSAAGAPVLRVYTWSPPTLSLGYGQRASDIDREACARQGVDVTRRLTGGRAVLHQHELTYSIIVPAALLNVGRSVVRAYDLLTAGLIQALQAVGIPVEPAPRSAGGSHDPACFATALGGDLSVAGRKLVGSAQCHRFDGILQHGSLPQRIDDELLASLLHRPPGARRQWTCLDELGVALTAEQFAEALADGYAELCGARPEVGEPTAEERGAMEGLAAKYAGEEWVGKVG